MKQPNGRSGIINKFKEIVETLATVIWYIFMPIVIIFIIGTIYHFLSLPYLLR